MRVTTQREYLVWLQWLDDQWNMPSRGDKYLMQLTLYVANVISKKFVGKLEDFQLKFTRQVDKPKVSKQQIEIVSAEAKSRWKRFLGRK